MNKLYNGTYEEALEIIFSLLDINNDGIIELDNVRMMLSYLTLKIHKYNIEYKYQMKSLDEIDEILKCSFRDKKYINRRIFYRKSDSYL